MSDRTPAALHTIVLPPDLTPQQLRETLAVAQDQVGLSDVRPPTKRAHLTRIARLIAECDRLTPAELCICRGNHGDAWCDPACPACTTPKAATVPSPAPAAPAPDSQPEPAVTIGLRHRAVDELLEHFTYAHLTNAELAATSKQFHDLAHWLADNLPDGGAELTVGLRKLLEAKDCAVRAHARRLRNAGTIR